MIPSYEGLRQWVVVARTGGDITARSAAARLSVIDRAEDLGVPPPDIREWEPDEVRISHHEVRTGRDPGDESDQP